MVHGDWGRLAFEVQRERHSRRQTQKAFARDIGISARTLRSIETAERNGYNERTVMAIELAMAWRPGSFERVVSGLPPRTSDKHLATLLTAWPSLSIDNRAMLVRIALDAARSR